MNYWISSRWKDSYLTWNPPDFGNITQLILPPAYIWLPDIGLWNSRGDVYNEQHFKLSKVRIASDGTVAWSPGGEAQINCMLNARKFPFDTQTCVMLIEPDKSFLAHQQFHVPKRVSHLRSNTHGVWQVQRIWNEAKTLNASSAQFGQFYAHIVLKRKAAYFVTYMIAPCIMLGFLNLFVFVLPSSSGEKISLGITIIMSHFIFLVIIAEHLPQNSDHIPAFAIYLDVTILLSALSVVCSTGILYVINCHPNHEVVAWLQGIMHYLQTKRKLCVEGYSAGDNKTTIEKKAAHSVCEVDDKKCCSLGRFLDKMFFMFFSTVYLTLTAAFFITVLK